MCAVCEGAGCNEALAERDSAQLTHADVGQSEQWAGRRASQLGQWMSWCPGLGLEQISLVCALVEPAKILIHSSVLQT